MSRKHTPNGFKPTLPSKAQIENTEFMGWQYLGDGIFSQKDQLGYFSESGWCVEDAYEAPSTKNINQSEVDAV